MRFAFLRRHTLGATVALVALVSTSLPATPAYAASYADLSFAITGPTVVDQSTTTVRYTMTVANAGPATVNFNPYASASFPGNVTKIRAVPGADCSFNKVGSVSCGFKKLKAKSVYTFDIDVDVGPTITRFCNGETNISKTAMGSINFSMWIYTDPNLENNHDTKTFQISCAPRVVANLYVTESAPTYPAHQLLGGALGDPVLGLDLVAKDEDVNVTTLRFAVTSSANAIRAIDRLELYLNGTTTPFAVATIAGCGSLTIPKGTFCAALTSQPVLVLKDQKASIVVRPRVKTDTDGTVTNTPITVGLQQWAVKPVDAVTKVSGVQLLKNDGDAVAEGEVFIGTAVPAPDTQIVGEQNVAVLSKIVSITNANPDADGTAVPTGSARALGQFKLTAASASNTLNGLNRFTLDRAIFTVDLQNVAVNTSSFKLYNKADASMKSPCVVDPASTATQLFVDCAEISASGVSSGVEQGSSSTFVLESTIINAQVNPSAASSIQVSFEQYADATKTTVSPSGSHVSWLDRDFASAVPFTWIESSTSVVRSTKYDTPAQSRLLGDVNNDKALNSPDATLIRRHLGGVITLTGEDFIAADVDLDGEITHADLYLLRGAIGQMITLPALYGDVDDDGVVTSDDVALIADFASGVKTPTKRQQYLGDVNVDGIIDQKDVDLTAEAVQKIVFLPVLCGNSILNIDVFEQCDDGNRVNGDGCSNMCVIEELVQNELTITQKALVSSDAAVQNQKNVSLLRFEAYADNENVLVTSFIFAAQQGSLNNAMNYTLMVDANGDGVVETAVQSGVVPSLGFIRFSELTNAGYSLPALQPVVFEVRADIASVLTDDRLQLKFATSESEYIGAERLGTSDTLNGIKTDGVCATTCEITVQTTPSTVWYLTSQGNLFITQSSTPVRSHQLLGGTLSDDVLRLNFRADSEDIDVSRLVFTAQGPNASSFTRNVSRLDLYQEGAITPFATASVGVCGADPVPANSMCVVMRNSEFIVTKGSSVEVVVRAFVRSDADGAVSGTKFALTVDASKGAQARGVSSSNALLENDGDAVAEGEVFIGVSAPSVSQTIVGKAHAVVMSKVVNITNVDPNVNGSAIPVGSNRAISQLKFSATNHSNFSNGMNKVVLDTVIYTVNATNVDLDPSRFKIYNKADSMMQASCTLDPASTATMKYVVCSNLSTGVINTEIDAGSNATLVLEANILNPQVNPTLSSTLQVSLQNFSDSTASAVSALGSHIRWYDQDFVLSQPFLWFDLPENVINGTQYQN